MLNSKKLCVLLYCFILNTDVIGKQWIIVYSQEASPSPKVLPHAYAQFIQEDIASKLPTEYGVWGFAPIEGRRPFGEGDIQRPGNYPKHSFFITEVTDLEWKLSLSIVGKWKEKYYSLTWNNCVKFTREILANIKILQLPPMEYQTPGEYVDMLKILNSEWEEHSRLSYEFSMKESKSNKEAFNPFVGYWEGKATYWQLPNQETINFDIQKDPNSKNALITASYMIDGISKTETLKGTFNGVVLLNIPFHSPDKTDAKKLCNGFLILHTTGEDKIHGIFGTEDSAGENRGLDCRPVEYIATRKIKPLEKSASLTFKINPKDVTHSTDKNFKWYDWDKAPEDLKTAARYIHTFKNQQTSKDEILIDEINENIEEKCSVKIAAVDLDGDGICGLATFAKGGTFCCGSRGCSFRLYDNGGLITVDLGTDEDVKPSKNGVMSRANHFFPLKRNTRITVDEKEVIKSFTYEKTKQSIHVKSSSALVGGITPEELGKILLKALKTNNKELWDNCLHPDLDPNDNFNIQSFDRVRNGLIQNGITQWNLVEFSRVTYRTLDQGVHAIDFALEFLYKNKEFVGGVLIQSTKKYNGKYFIANPAIDYGVQRNNVRQH